MAHRYFPPSGAQRYAATVRAANSRCVVARLTNKNLASRQPSLSVLASRSLEILPGDAYLYSIGRRHPRSMLHRKSWLTKARPPSPFRCLLQLVTYHNLGCPLGLTRLLDERLHVNPDVGVLALREMEHRGKRQLLTRDFGKGEMVVPILLDDLGRIG